MRARDLAPALLLLALGAFVGAQALGARARGDAATEAGRDAALPPSAARVAAPPPVRPAGPPAAPAAPRWPHVAQGRALRVWVRPASAIRGWHPALVADARRAFDVWARAVPLRVAFTNDSAAADVHVRWAARLAHDRQVGGNRLVHTPDGAIVRAEVTLAVHDAAGAPLAPGVRALTAVHEAGHAIGLAHSPDAADVMAARHPPTARAEPTAADVAAARALYPRRP